MKEGISIIICCYNSGWIIERTLMSLCTQCGLESIEYEIVVVNNCSTDNTQEIVVNIVDKFPFVTIKAVYEDTPGLMFARKKGISVSKFSYLLFCDDDNVLCSNYVSTIFNVMQSDSNIGACGGCGVAEFYGCEKPIWFDTFQACYAIGKQNLKKHELYGAGSCYRREAMSIFEKSEMKPFLTGRKGNVLLAGDDSEITKSICIAGYKLCSLDSITFHHILPAKRLNETYLYKMLEGFGIAYLPLYMYDSVLERKTFNILTYNFRFLYFGIRYVTYAVLRKICKSSISLSSKYHLTKGVLKSYQLFNFQSLMRGRKYYSILFSV